MVVHTMWDADAELATSDMVQGVVTDYICVSTANAQHLIGHGADRTKVHVVRNAVDPSSIAGKHDVRSQLAIPKGLPLLLHLGRICDEKGSPLVAHALRRASGDWCGLFVGWGDKINDRAADLLVLPTKAEGGIPYVVMEAGLCGLPVAITPVSDVPHLFQDKVSYLRIGRDVPSIVEAMEWATEDRSRLRDVGENGKRVIENACNLKEMVSHYHSILLGYN